MFGMLTLRKYPERSLDSFALTGLVEQSILQYVGFSAAGATIDEKAEILFLGQLSVTAVVLGVIFSITNTFRPFPDDVFRYDVKEPFKLQNGWLLWAGIGLFGAVISIALVGAAMTYLNGAPPEREKDSLVLLLPLIGSSTLSTAYLVGITGVLAPILEETVFRGFLMVSLTKWFPTPVCVILSAAVFAFAHLTPDQFPQLFVLGVALGFTYAQTRNLLAPITIHAFWNSGVILLLTFLQQVHKSWKRKNPTRRLGNKTKIMPLWQERSGAPRTTNQECDKDIEKDLIK
ncbi:Putative membrane peptidase ydiL [Triticum urartu]|uniref:Putative membrane peptidase ydiL n=1 Tax=Triticum urartu TaxID=4572 RepID=M8A6W5_TRIUA|nr:Putative membrane peptidase ydiL [Triticum urartu]